jgi:iron complex outermembrane receptor protein
MNLGCRLRQWKGIGTSVGWSSCAVWLAATLSLHAQQLPSPQTAAGAQTNAPPASVSPPPTSTDASAPPAEAQDSNVYKNMSLQELMEQQVTSVSKTPEPYEDAPAAIQVITNDEIRRSGAFSLPEALRLADNLEVAQDNSHDWNISAHGFDTGLADKLLVLIDGRAVYTPLYSGVEWDVQNVMLEDVDRIEVISGPGGTLWGANAVNGVINIVSKSAQDTQGWFMDAGGGSELRDFGEIRYGGTLAPNVYYRVYGTYFDQNAEDYTGGGSANDVWSQGQGGFRIDTAGASDDKFTVQGDYYNGAAGDPTLPETTEVQSGGNILGRWTHTVSSDSDMSLQVYYDRTDYSQGEPAIGFEPEGTLTDSLDTADLDFQHHFNLGDRNKITWGTGYRFYHDVVGNAPAVQVLPSTQNLNIYNVFAQDEIKILDNLHFTLGTKVEHNDYTGFEFEPSARLQWNVTSKQMIWAAVSRAVRTPSILDRSLYEQTGYPAPYQTLLEGSTSFQSEELIAYELGYRAQLGDKVSGSISTYYNDYTNIRSTTPGPTSSFGLPLVFQNNLEGQTYGIEVSSDYQMLDWWRWHAGYDFLKEDIHVKPGEVDYDNGLNETADPQNQVFLRSSMDLPQNMEFDTGGRFIDSLTINNGPTAATVPGYFELDARLAWHPTKNIEISVVGQNLLQNQHAEYGFPSPTQVQIGRSVYGKIAWHF